jgi:sulfur carrier protein ThiS
MQTNPKPTAVPIVVQGLVNACLPRLVPEHMDSKSQTKKEVSMKVQLKCFSTLVNPDTCDYRDSTAYELSEGQTVEDLMKQTDITPEDVKIAFVNGRIVSFDTALSDGDQVGLAPAVGGM